MSVSASAPDSEARTCNADFAAVPDPFASENKAVVASRRVVYIVVAAEVVAACCSCYLESSDNPLDHHSVEDRTAVLDVGRIVAGRRCKRGLAGDIDLDMVARLGCRIVGSQNARVLGCCCRFVDGSSSRCSYAVVV